MEVLAIHDPLRFCAGCLKTLTPGEKIFVEVLTNVRNPLIRGRSNVFIFCPKCEKEFENGFTKRSREWKRLRKPKETIYR